MVRVRRRAGGLAGAALVLALAAACGGPGRGAGGGGRAPGEGGVAEEGRALEEGAVVGRGAGAAGPAGGGEAGAAAAAGDDVAVDPALVAVLLPLEGRHAALGREIRAAIEIAGAGAAGRGARLRFLDTRGEAELAARRVEEASEAGAIAVLGPVGVAEGDAAAARARALGLPIALLAPGEGADPAAGVFRLMTSPEHDAAEAARLAIERGHDRLAVLAPRDPVGAAQAEAFARAAREGGVELVASGSYEPDGRTIEAEVKALLGLDPATNERLRRHLRARGVKNGWKSFSPDVAFDLLYVPDQHRRAALVASFLPYFNVEVRTGELMDTLSLRRKHGGRIPSVVQLMGSSGWHHPGLLTRGGPAVDGALVVVPCEVGVDAGLGADLPEATARFRERFEARTRRPPGPVAAQAFDAALLLLAARAAAADRTPPARGAALRDRLRAALIGARLDAAGCAPARVGRGGAIERPAWLLQVESGAFVPVVL